MYTIQGIQQRTRTVARNVNPEYTSLLHFPAIVRDQLSAMHMLITILGTGAYTGFI